MINIELNTALLFFFFLYIGVQKDTTHVWGKPIGYTILTAFVTPNMEDVEISSLCRIYEKNGEKKTVMYASIKYSEKYDKDVPIANATYNDFVEFIKYAEFNAKIENAIYSSVGSHIDFSFRNNLDYESQKFVKY